MAITYSDFLTQVRNYTEVDSNVLSDTIIGQFIRNTELNVAGSVDYDDTRKYATSSFTANKRYLVTPADFLVIRSLQVFSTTDQTGDRTFMEKRDTSFISEYNGSNTTGLPKYYANWDDASIVVDKSYPSLVDSDRVEIEGNGLFTVIVHDINGNKISTRLLKI